MKIRALILTAIALVAVSTSAQAQNKTKEKSGAASSSLVDGSNLDAILEAARAYGTAELETQSNGDPKITGVVDDVQYAVYFMNCTDNENCEDINFYAGFLDIKPDMDTINDWNRDKRFGKAYIDSDGDAVIEMDLNLEHGISAENLQADFAVWTLVLDQYIDHIGFEK